LPPKSNILDSFRWFFSPQANPFGSPYQVPVVRIVESPELEPEKIPEVLREINDRQFGCVLQVLIESKYKAEAMLRNDEVMHSHGRIAFYQGWVAYADYVIGSLSGLRSRPSQERPERELGPEN
jgi:hypothetical protein